MNDEEREQFDKREGAARIARAAAGTFPIFEQSVAWYTMIRAIKMAQDEVRQERGNMRYYVLEGKKAVQTDAKHWASVFGDNRRIVAQSVTPDETFISTVFLGIDHSFLDSGDPMVFETMVFDDDMGELEMRRYSTWEEALEGHHDLDAKYTRQKNNRRQAAWAG